MAKRCPQCAVDHNRSSLYCSSSCYNRSWYAKNKEKIRLAAESQHGTQLLTEEEIKESLSLITELRDVVPGKLCGIARNTGIHRHALMRILAGDRDPVRVELWRIKMKEGTIAVTMQLKQIIQNFASRNPEQLEFLIEDIIAKQSSLVENLGKLKDVDKVKILLDLCDEAIKEERSQSKYSKDIQCDNCNKAYCCQIFCAVSVPETKYIMLDLNIYSIGMLKSWLGDKAWERLSAQVELYQSMKDATAEKHEEAYGSLSLENRRCVFLGEDNLCRVYSNRPINCRKHFVLSDKDECNWQPESNTKSQKTVNFASVNAEIIATYTHRFSKQNLPLSLAIFESFGVCQ